MSETTKSFIHAPWVTELSFVLVATLIMLIVALIGGRLARQRYYSGDVRSPELFVISLYAAIGAIALFASIFTLRAALLHKS